MAKKPADHKAKKHPKSEMFVYETDDVRIEIPYAENAKMGVFRRAAAADDETTMMFLILEGLGADMDQVDELTQGEFIEMMKRWEDESAVDVGESLAS